MQNNQIIVTDDTLGTYARRNSYGVIDATNLPDDEWAELCARNVNSPQARIVKCGFCWVDHSEIQWMKTFVRMGTRVVSHQAGEALDHPYQSVETPRHKAYKERAYLLGDREGLDPEKEAEAEDGKTIADALLKGVVKLAYEHQHSPFKVGYGLTERIQRAANADRIAMFHTDQDHVFNAQHAPILRTDGKVPFEWIEDLNRPLIVTGGLREITVFTCDVRNGVWCPKGRISGCGKTHARTEPLRGIPLDEALIHGAMDEYRYIFNAQVTKLPKSFWTDRKSYDRYMSALGGDGKLAPLEGAPADKAKTRSGTREGHSRRNGIGLAAMRVQAVDLSALATPDPERLGAPVVPRPTCQPQIAVVSETCLACGRPTQLHDNADRPRCWSCKWPHGRPLAPKVVPGRCDAGVTPCGAPARPYAGGWRCDAHSPGAIARHMREQGRGA